MVNLSIKRIVKYINIFLFIIINYLVVCFLIYIFSGFLLINNIRPNIKLIKDYQRNFYQVGGLMNIWQANKNCIEYDKDVIFKPKSTSCKFNNLEFKTTLKFNANGRYSNIKKNLNKKFITVIGDSHGMGWGVNDDQTFSYLLEKQINRPVYNLSVSGFATIRELIRLEKSGLLEKSDTIIIQYCFNDFGENVNFKIENEEKTKKKFEMIINGKKMGFFKKLRKSFRYSATIPIDILTNKNKSMDFNHHEKVLYETLKKFPSLKEKKILLIYVNGFDMFFHNFPKGQSKKIKNLYFVELNLTEQDFFQIDGHLNQKGHSKIADKLFSFLNN